MEYKSSWESPSNIALVKYWGKKPGQVQIPANPSLSFTLSECKSQTEVRYDEGSTVALEFLFKGEPKPSFVPKIEDFFKRIESFVPWINEGSFRINSFNTFPHGAGIASSASAMSALALCITDIADQKGQLAEYEFFSFASELARLGSGSACRSVYAPMAEWGEHKDFHEASDYAALKFDEIHPVFKDFRDTILIVETDEKQVSSTAGHALLEDHPFAALRYQSAHENLSELKEAMQKGDLVTFIKVVENEAFMLHALMMTSDPAFLLMRGGTVHIIHRIQKYRKLLKKNWCFTLDAGANVHFLYPDADHVEALAFIEAELKQFCEKGLYICDKVGKGPNRL